MDKNNRGKLRKASMVLSLFIGLLLMIAALAFAEINVAFAADSADLDVAILGTSTFPMDSNGFCSDTDGPDGIWLPVVITNTHALDTLYGLEAELTAPSDAPSDDPERYIGNLAPGESAEMFFFFDYRALRTDPNCDSSQTGDGWYSKNYTIEIKSLSDNQFGTKSFFDTFDTHQMLSASAGGARFSDRLGEGIAVGQIFTQSVVYDFGQNSSTDLLLQPAGNGTFNDQCFRLVGAEVTASDFTGVDVGVENRLFFTNIDSSNNDKATIEYEWQALCSPGSGTPVYSWAMMISGNDFKYASNGYNENTFPLPDPVIGIVSMNKVAQLPSNFVFGVNDPMVVTYTVQFDNIYTQPILLSSIYDKMSAQAGNTFAFGTHLAASQISETNSTIYPPLGATEVISWYGIPAATSYIIPAEGGLTLIYTASLEYNHLNPVEQLFTNTVTATIGNEVLGPSSYHIRVSTTPTAITLETFTAKAVGFPSILIVGAMVVFGSTIGYYGYRKTRSNKLVNADSK